MKVEIEIKFDQINTATAFLQGMGIFDNITFHGKAGTSTCFIKGDVSETKMKDKLVNGLTSLIPGLTRNHVCVDGDA